MQKFSEFLVKNVFNIFIWFLVILNVLPFLAPIFQSLGIDFFADIIYSIYSLSCHQFHWRSLHIFGYQVAWCTRDTFIWLGLLAVSFVVHKGWIKKAAPFYWIIPFLIPIAMDGGIQTIATMMGFGSNEQFYLSTNFMRMVTGSIFGLGLGITIAPYMKEEQDYARQLNNIQISTKTEKNGLIDNSLGKFLKKRSVILFFCFTSLFLFYLFLVQIWRISTPEYPPVGLVDNEIRKAPPVGKWIDSRGLHKE